MNTNNRTTTEKADDQKQRLAALIPPTVGLILIIVIATSLYWQRAAENAMATSGDPPGLLDGGAFMPPIPMPPVDTLDSVMIKAYLKVNPTAREIKREPANIPPCTLPKAVREGGIALEREGFNDHASVWTIPDTPPQRVDAFYTQQLTSTRFKPLALFGDAELNLSREQPVAPLIQPASPATLPSSNLEPPVNRVFTAVAPANRRMDPMLDVMADWEVLVIRYRALPSGGTRVVVWHRKLSPAPPPVPAPAPTATAPAH